MPDSPQVTVIRRLYEARGNPDIIQQLLAPDVRWEVVAGFPHGGVYVGLDDVLGNFFGRLFRDFESFVADGSEFFVSGDHVIALGFYSGRARATGRDFTARFAHAVAEFGPSYHRATFLQVPLAIAGLVAGAGAWISGSGLGWLIGGVALGSVVPFTVLVIFPTNKRLLDPRLDRGSQLASDLLHRWACLHGVRSVLSLGAFVLFVWLRGFRV